MSVTTEVEKLHVGGTHIPDLAKVIEAGLDSKDLDSLGRRLGLNKSEALKLVGTNRTQISRKDGRLGAAASEKVLLLQELARDGREAFPDDPEGFFEWLQRGNPLLGGLTPLKACELTLGIYEVRKILHRIRTADFIA